MIKENINPLNQGDRHKTSSSQNASTAQNVLINQKRKKLLTFQCEDAKNKVVGNDKLFAVKMSQDLFGSILYWSLEKKY